LKSPIFSHPYCQFSSFLVIDENVKKYRFSNFLGPALKKSSYLQAENTLKVISKDPSFQQKKIGAALSHPLEIFILKFYRHG
jgi:hypothetical protein